ncbi:hypothetical protein RKE25_11580 [Dyella sp. BiH032]|uniref:tetratricopeptide repeat protein n=1 Tax=Dyella sp. BiH032 TaxID=3075430 RepID=UPI002892EA3D|nr:hypothetical protein [Dyella sp. BiH032]WNL44071.1 hypothetical protein RKE25_11580 [Dyella sp. BiH032]
MFGFFKKRKKTAAAATPVAQDQSAGEQRLISFVDAYGRSFQVPLEQWRESVLRPNLQAKWDSPDELYSLILSALGDDLAADVDQASARLLEIDPTPERAFVTRAIVQMRLERLEDAGATLRKAIAQLGESGILLTNLAKVIDMQGDHAWAMATLDRALELDPNQDNGLGWRIAVLNEAQGEAAAGAYLRNLAARPDSWYPQLLLGRGAVRAGRREEGLAWFDQALARAPHGSGLLLTVTGELGQQGLLNDAVQRVAPLYDERRDDIRVGYNLLQAYLELGDAGTGRALLDRLFALGQPAYAEPLQHFAKAFDEMIVEPPKTLHHEPQLQMMQLASPPWLLGMHDMAWAAPARGENRPRVVLLPLAATGEALEGHGRTGREDERGRLSRALPLLLLEQLIYCSDLDAIFNVPVADGHNLVLFGRPIGDEELEFLAGEFAFAAEGEIAALEGERFKITYRLRKLDDLAIVRQVEREFGAADAGDALIAITGEVLSALGAATASVIEPRVPMYALPAACASEYVSALGQALSLTLVCLADARDTLFGERNIYGWMQSLAVALPDNDPAQFMYFTALAKGRRMGSPIVDEFEKPAAQRMRELVRAGRYPARLLPLIVAVYPDNDELGELLAAAVPVSDETYGTWCARISGAFGAASAKPSDS